MWKKSRWPSSLTFGLGANLRTLRLTSTATLSPAFKRKLSGLTVYLSELPGLILASTVAPSLFVMSSVWV